VVTDIVTTGIIGDAELLQLAASAEKGSEHPLGEAIVNAAKEKNLELLAVDSFETIPGHGTDVVIQNRKILLGNRKFMLDRQVGLALESDNDRLADEGKTPMYIAVDSKLAGIIAVADVMKPSSRRAIEILHGMGLEVAMITGDNRKTA
jgi:Cu+-exporting ATPase